MARRSVAHGTRIYTLIWLGQLISSLGTGLGSFALGVWIFSETGSVTLFGTMTFVAVATGIVTAPVAGVVADRYDRRWVMILGDTAAGMVTLVMAALLFMDQLQIWQVFVIVPLMVAFGTFQGAAFVASVPTLVPREHLARASGMAQISTSLAGIVAPLAAGFLLVYIGYHGVVSLDVASFLLAVTTLFLVRIPKPPPSNRGTERRPFWRDAFFGLGYILERKGLLALLILFALTNFSLGMVQVLITPLVLSFGGSVELGTVNAAGAFGGLIGALTLSVWGGPNRKVWAIFFFLLVQGSVLFLGGMEPSVTLIAIAAAVFIGAGPFITGMSQAIWQSKVELDLQGRVLAMRRMVAQGLMPLGFLVAGPLADGVFEPLLMPGGALAPTVGRWIGVGPGRGMGLLFIVLGLFILVATALSFLNPRLRKVETELPDQQPDELDEPEEPEAPEVSSRAF